MLKLSFIDKQLGLPDYGHFEKVAILSDFGLHNIEEMHQNACRLSLFKLGRLILIMQFFSFLRTK